MPGRASRSSIPGSRWMTAEAIDDHEAAFLRARELVLYGS
jgi:hypothetical protein